MLKDLSDLEAFFKLCRKQGVTDITLEGIQVKFGDLPTKPRKSSDASEEIPSEEPSSEQLMFYAVRDQG